ncbi:MAG TPA: hypothetical protein VK802_18360 [Streptosporangiaceae bacterium]|jgi:hypothetical protein|nr:hypothetical protein [Streptosporangiaceae bacterium]
MGRSANVIAAYLLRIQQQQGSSHDVGAWGCGPMAADNEPTAPRTACSPSAVLAVVGSR